MSQIKVKLQKSGKTLACQASHKNLLEVLEYHHVSIEYQCRKGYCGSCRVRLLKGDVTYSEQPLAFVQQGDILPCCCMPVNDIELEF